MKNVPRGVFAGHFIWSTADGIRTQIHVIGANLEQAKSHLIPPPILLATGERQLI